MNKDNLQSETFGLFSPLLLPQKYRSKVFNVSILRHLSISLMLNVLSLAVPVMMLQVYDRIIPHNSFGTLALLTMGVLIALFLDAALRIIRSGLTGWAAASNEHLTSSAALDHFNRADLVTISKYSTGEHLQSFNAISRLREFFSGQNLAALIDLPFAVIFLGLIAYLGGYLVIVPCVLLIAFFFCAWRISKKLKYALTQRMNADDKKSNTVVSILSGIHTVKSLGLESFLLRHYEHDQAEVTLQSYHVSEVTGKAATLGAVSGQLSLILTAAVGCMLVMQGSITVGALSACTLLAGRAIQPVQRVLGIWLRLQDLSLAKHQAKKIFHLPVLKQPSEIFLPQESRTLVADKINFSYDEKNIVLKNISFEISPGRCIAITGEKSSGKSTLLKLLACVLTPQQGDVQLNGHSILNYNLSDLKGEVAYLPQEGRIFRGTVIENMTGFRDDENIVLAAKSAGIDLGLDTIIDFLPHGYQTILTDTAADPIPPGIKQRIALVRALADNPKIILFDDADRALDKDGYNKIFRLMGRLKGKRSIVIVSHDKNLLSFSDETYFLHSGTLQKMNRDNEQKISYLNFMRGGL